MVHRLDRPVSGLVVFAKTSKALTRLNKMFANGEVHKTYWAITKNLPPKEEGRLENWIVRNEKQNKSYAYDTEKPNGKKAVLRYRIIARGDRYSLAEVTLLTGRSPSDTLSAGPHRLSHPGRPEVWRTQEQSRRQHLAAGPSPGVRPSGELE